MTVVAVPVLGFNQQLELDSWNKLADLCNGVTLANPAGAPTVIAAIGVGGTLAAANYDVAITLANFAGETLKSPTTVGVTVAGANNSLAVTAPAVVSGANGYNVYAAISGNPLVKQNATVVGFGANYTVLSLASLGAGPVANTANTDSSLRVLGTNFAPTPAGAAGVSQLKLGQTLPKIVHSETGLATLGTPIEMTDGAFRVVSIPHTIAADTGYAWQENLGKVDWMDLTQPLAVVLAYKMSGVSGTSLQLQLTYTVDGVTNTSPWETVVPPNSNSPRLLISAVMLVPGGSFVENSQVTFDVHRRSAAGFPTDTLEDFRIIAHGYQYKGR